MKAPSTYPLRLPRSLRAAVERASKEDGTSINQFVTMAVAEKLSALDAVAFFEARRNRADLKAFDAIMSRKGGQSPTTGDERRESLRRKSERKHG
ncbi:MAG TPA: hypothetical protein PKE27_01280 [Povalibacter sp.]|uniref:hypothetical protein n=1 Tax=Povalibacter sp. TaxID=1962978 RepID=UPI002CAD2695|nr:hypothetical protein [Povalibacter sp.]HMN43181.1 hypothetical protein [Povalibacter sp.]